jgi:hypothetical protein
MNRSFLFVMALAGLAPAAFAQTAARLDPGSDQQVARNQEMMNRQAQDAMHDMVLGERQSGLDALANLAKLRTKLVEAWQAMGMSPQDATRVAEAYDPELAATMHHASLHGKSDEEIARLLQSAIEQKHYLNANQLLIDYQRDKLGMGAVAAH